MVCANFGEDQMKFVTSENVLVFSIKYNMAAESITLKSEIAICPHKDLPQYY